MPTPRAAAPGWAGVSSGPAGQTRRRFFHTHGPEERRKGPLEFQSGPKKKAAGGVSSALPSPNAAPLHGGPDENFTLVEEKPDLTGAPHGKRKGYLELNPARGNVKYPNWNAGLQTGPERLGRGDPSCRAMLHAKPSLAGDRLPESVQTRLPCGSSRM